MTEWLEIHNAFFGMRHIEILSYFFKALLISFVLTIFFGLAVGIILRTFRRWSLPVFVIGFVLLVLSFDWIPHLNAILGMAPPESDSYVNYIAPFQESSGFILIPFCLSVGIFVFSSLKLDRWHLPMWGHALIRLTCVLLGGFVGGISAAIIQNLL